MSGWNAFDLRMYDARFGRWLSPDPYGQFASPYVGMGNNPTIIVDRDGGFSCPGCDEALAQWGALSEAYATTTSRIILQDGIKIWTTAGTLGKMLGRIEYELPSQVQGRLASYSSPQIQDVWQSPANMFNVESPMLPPDPNDPRLQWMGDVVREGRAPAGRFITQVMLTVVGPELIVGKAFAGIAGLARFGGAAAPSSKVLNFTAKQLEKKFKHAADFGVLGNYSGAQAARYSAAINQHINGAGTQVIMGAFKNSQNKVIFHLNPHTGLNVISTPAGEFISGFRLSPAQVKIYLQRAFYGK